MKIFLIFILLLINKAYANEDQASIKRIVSSFNGALKEEQISATDIGGVFQVQLAGNRFVYMSSNGKHFIKGDFHSIIDGRVINKTELRRSKNRNGLLKNINPSDLIIYEPLSWDGKHEIYVFTDVDCFYCQRFHKSLSNYLDAGIKITYLAYPRAGEGSDTYRKMSAIWCASDKKKSITAAKNKEAIPSDQCANNIITSQMSMGALMGVKGTPTIYLGDGSLFNGPPSPSKIIKALSRQ